MPHSDIFSHLRTFPRAQCQSHMFEWPPTLWPPAPVTVMLHAVYDFILNRATLSLKCSFSMVYAHTIMHTTFWHWNSSKCISQLYLLVIAPPWTVTFPVTSLPKRSHLRKSIRNWHMASLTSHLSISQQKQWSDQCTRKVPWGDHSRGQHQWHQANSQWHFCQ